MENFHSSSWWSEEESDWLNWLNHSNSDSSFPENNEFSSSSSSFMMVPSCSAPSSSTSCHFHEDPTPLSHPFNHQTTIQGLAADTNTPSAASNKSHSLAEKRRRDRINAQLASLRKVIPKSDKMDKAALLGSVIEEVKELKRKASKISQTVVVPTETDEVSIDMDVHHAPSKSCIFIRASLCCDDRPELYAELVRVLKGLKLTTVRADITSVGGRTRSILVLCSNDNEAEGFSATNLQNSLKVVLSRIASASMAAGCRSIRSKRQRFFFH